MSLLHSFASLTLVSVLVLTLLPEGTLRRTASMAVGLLMLLLWAEGLPALFSLPDAAPSPASILAPTGADLDAQESSARAALHTLWEETP